MNNLTVKIVELETQIKMLEKAQEKTNAEIARLLTIHGEILKIFQNCEKRVNESEKHSKRGKKCVE